VGYIFYLLAAVVGIIAGAVNIAFMSIGGVGSLIWGVISLILFLLIAAPLKNKIDTGKVDEQIKSESLVAGILGIFFAWIIGGIMFLVAYSKVQTILYRRSIPPPPPPPTPVSAPTPTVSLRYCVHCGRTIPTDAKVCPYCGKQL
jgi:hypothetical protein